MKGKALTSEDVEKIKNIINVHGEHCTAEELGKLAGVSEVTIRRVQHGKYDNKFNNLYDLLKCRDLCDEDIKLAIAVIERLRYRGK